MEHAEFQKVMDAQLEWCKKTLGSKNEEYARGGDKLHNFKVAARMEDTTQEKALWGMLLKHWVSVRDTVFNEAPIPLGQCKIPQAAYLDEKIGDSINYLLLLRAMFEEQRNAVNAMPPAAFTLDKITILDRNATIGIGEPRGVMAENGSNKIWDECTRTWTNKQ